MIALGPLAFTTPWLLAGLVVLPVLWFLLRAVPPAPVRRLFPAVTLLLGLKDPENTPDRTPWWLLVLRLLAIAALIAGFAGPVLNPAARDTGQGPLLIVMDGGWPSAPDWPRRVERALSIAETAGRAGRPVAFQMLTDPPRGDGPDFADAAEAAGRIAAASPHAWEADPDAYTGWIAAGAADHATIWMSDGLERPGRDALAAALMARGPLEVIHGSLPVLALGAPRVEDGALVLDLLRAPGADGLEASVNAIGPDPAGIPRILAASTVTMPPGAGSASVTFDLPIELRNRVERFEIAGAGSAGAVALTDSAHKRRKVALAAAVAGREGDDLLSPLHYLRRALAPTTALTEASIADLLLGDPDVLILADVGLLPAAEAEGVEKWVRDGGLLIRFAGPRLAASTLERRSDDPLLPVRLRVGGRSVGGAMSWGAPRGLAPFAEGSAFFGLDLPAEVTVSSQVLAQPAPDLAARTIASLQDGTPLVTERPLGEGSVVLFHVTANAEWSNLPLSGLFVSMLGRLTVLAAASRDKAADVAARNWLPERRLDAFGSLQDATGGAEILGEVLAALAPSAETPPGIYRASADTLALNALAPGRELATARWPAGVAVGGIEGPQEQRLAGPVLGLGLVLLILDIFAALAISGRLRGSQGGVIAGAVALAMLATAPGGTRAQTAEDFAQAATESTVLAYVETGDARVDAISRAGLRGLGLVLTRRTAVEPGPPMAVNVETDELAFFPILYWPVTGAQALPSATAIAKLNRYLATGGMILFDTRDADLGAGTQAGDRLQLIAAPLAIPALELLPRDHVLTRSFYLLQDFPGRHAGPDIWVEAAPDASAQTPGVPFRQLNDGVSPVVIGGNDWAAAWAVDDNGLYLFPVGRGAAGDVQREISFRFGVNLVMYALTGNYKSDQVHVPALLERLGQ